MAEKCSTSSVIKKMQIETAIRFYLTPVIIAQKNQKDSKFCSWHGGTETLTIGRDVKSVQPPKKISVDVQQKGRKRVTI